MAFRLPPSAISAGYGLRSFDAVGSTNAEALDAARSGEHGPVWFVLRPAGSRSWSSRPRLGHRKGQSRCDPDAFPRRRDGLGRNARFVAGLALSDALAAGRRKAASPWRRMAARYPVRASVASSSNGRMTCSPPGPSSPESCSNRRRCKSAGMRSRSVSASTSCPRRATCHIRRRTFARSLGLRCAEPVLRACDAWTDCMRLWNGGRGLSAIRHRWLDKAAGLGSEVAVQVDGGVERGVFETIDEDCRFVIRAGDGRVIRITAGDVHFGAVASAAAQA